jgi:hypothetical protein
MPHQPHDDLYAAVALEISDRKINPALWARALSRERGDPHKSLATYIDFRVAQLVEENSQANRESLILVASSPSPARYKVQNGAKVAVILACPHCGSDTLAPLKSTSEPVKCDRCSMRYILDRKTK